jgi:hypothetical protein
LADGRSWQNCARFWLLQPRRCKYPRNPYAPILCIFTLALDSTGSDATLVSLTCVFAISFATHKDSQQGFRRDAGARKLAGIWSFLARPAVTQRGPRLTASEFSRLRYLLSLIGGFPNEPNCHFGYCDFLRDRRVCHVQQQRFCRPARRRKQLQWLPWSPLRRPS